MPRIFFLLFALLILTSCSKTSPAGFWENFHREMLVKNISDQGPGGGHRAMHWISPKQNAFDSAAVIAFAGKNGWHLTKAYSFKQDSAAKWMYDGKATFPLSNTGFNPYDSFNNSTYSLFPRRINSDLKVYQFKTGWMAIEPGSDKSTEENGFVLVNDSASKMSVYHIWGK